MYELFDFARDSVDSGLHTGSKIEYSVESGVGLESSYFERVRDFALPISGLDCEFNQRLFLDQVEEPKIVREQNRVNEQIRITPVRVIDDKGNQLGIIPTKDALTNARESGLDLVEVAPDASPPVCRIMDYGKFKYEKSKRTQKSSKTHQTKLKEIRLRPKTGQHDIDFKVKQAIGFLQHKDKVQVTVLFRGREMAHIEEGRKVMEGVIAQLSEHGKLESDPSQQSRRMICTIAPR